MSAEASQETNSPSNAIQIHSSTPKPIVPIGRNGLQLQDMDGLFRFAKAVSMSGLAPKGIETPEAVFVAVQMGLEIGLTPMAALQNIAVINGRPGIYGDAALALVRASGLLESYSERFEGAGDNYGCIVKSKRRGESDVMESKFTVADAKKAGLWGKSGPWSQYPDRMLKFRARGFNLRDNFGDVLKGFRTTEELGDIAEERFHSAKPANVAAEILDRALPPVSSESSSRVILNGQSTATAGLVAEQTAEPQKGGTLQAEIESILDGVTYSDFADWVRGTLATDISAYGAYSKLPDDFCEKLMAEPKQLVKCKKIYGKAVAK